MAKKTILLIMLICCNSVMATVTGSHDPWDGTLWDITAPTEDIAYGYADKELRDLRKGVAIRMNKEHETLATSSAGGVHKQGSARMWYLATASIPNLQPDGSTALDAGDNGMLWHDTTTDIIYALDDYSDPTVDGGWLSFGNFLGDVDVGASKVTMAAATGNTAVAGTLTVTGESTFNNHINLGAGDDLIGSSTSDIAFNTNKFTVAGATGNTLVAGTLDVSGNIDPTTYETTNGGFLDEDAMGSDAADKVASQQSIKAYIDTQIAFSAYTNEDSETNAMLKDHAYLAATDGFVVAKIQLSEITDELKGYVGATDDPAGAGVQICRQMTGSTANATATISFPVAEGEYFEIVTVSASTPTIQWKSRGTLSKPVDQD